MKDIWVLVADAGRARIFSAATTYGPLQELEGYTHPQSKLQGRQVWSDKPGSAFDSRGEGRHAMEPETTYKEQAKIDFARQLSHRLESAYLSGEFDKLVLVSEANFLGYLRRNINGHLRNAISCQLDKDLTHLPAAKIRAHLPEHLASSLA